MSGLLNQASPFIATAGATLILGNFFFNNSKNNKRLMSELESANNEIAKAAETNKELHKQMRAVAGEIKKIQESTGKNSKLTETATKNLQKQLDSLQKDLSEGKKIQFEELQKRDKDFEEVKKTSSKLSNEHTKVASSLNRLEGEMRKCGDVSSQIAAMKFQNKKEVLDFPSGASTPAAQGEYTSKPTDAVTDQAKQAVAKNLAKIAKKEMVDEKKH